MRRLTWTLLTAGALAAGGCAPVAQFGSTTRPAAEVLAGTLLAADARADVQGVGLGKATRQGGDVGDPEADRGGWNLFANVEGGALVALCGVALVLIVAAAVSFRFWALARRRGRANVFLAEELEARLPFRGSVHPDDPGQAARDGVGNRALRRGVYRETRRAVRKMRRSRRSNAVA